MYESTEVVETDLTRMTRNANLLADQLGTMRQQIAEVRGYLLANLIDLDEHATEIASLLGIELTRTATITVTITNTITIEDVPVDYDESELESDIHYYWNFEGSGDFRRGEINTTNIDAQVEDVVVDFDE